MKKHFAALVLALVPLVVAAEPPSKAVSEVARLRKNYEESLDLLLKKYLERGDLAAVEEIGLEIKKTRPEFPVPEAGPAPVGRWLWNGDYPVVIASSHVTVWNGKSFGIWKWINQSKREAQVSWASGYTDTFTISPDGKNLHVTNNHDEKYVVRKIEETK